MARTSNGLRALLVLVVACVLGACASATSSSALGNPVRLAVRNDLSPPVQITIYAGPSVGTRRRLGMVQGASRDTMELTRVTVTGSYVLQAEPLGGRTISSNTFTLTPDTELVEWILPTNIVTVR